MRMLTVAAGAALMILAAGSASAGDRDPRGGGCGSRCGGGHPGGGNINVNVNANANASARAYAGASASSWLNARAYNVGGIRGGAVGGGTVYVGGGYGGDMGGYYGGGAIYHELPSGRRACASAPFGYVVSGFGRNERRPPSCGGAYYEDRDRGGRYGYSERHEGYAESRYESRESYSEYEAYEGGWYSENDRGGRYEDRDDRRPPRRDDAFEAREYDRGYMDGRRDCDCRPDGRDGAPYIPAPEPGYEPPVYAPPPVYEAPMTPNQYYGVGDQSPPPRQYYRQEPGERG